MNQLVISLFLLSTGSLRSQSHELNIGAGCSYYYGDLSLLNSSSSILNFVTDGQNWDNYKASYSISYRFNFKSRYSLGLNFYHFNLAGYDSDNPNSGDLSDPVFFRRVRNLSFHTAVNQGYIDFRYEPFRMEEFPIFSPYLGIGLGIFSFNPRTILNDKEYELQPLGTEGQGVLGSKPKYSLAEFCLPLSIGVKFNIRNSPIAIGLDYSYNFTLTDYIDDVSTSYPDPSVLKSAWGDEKAMLINSLANRNLYGQGSTYSFITNPGEKRGDSKNKDHFMTAQIKLIYYFRNPNGASYYTIYR